MWEGEGRRQTERSVTAAQSMRDQHGWGDGSAGWILGHGAMGSVRPDLLVERELIARIERNMQCKWRL